MKILLPNEIISYLIKKTVSQLHPIISIGYFDISMFQKYGYNLIQLLCEAAINTRNDIHLVNYGKGIQIDICILEWESYDAADFAIFSHNYGEYLILYDNANEVFKESINNQTNYSFADESLNDDDYRNEIIDSQKNVYKNKFENNSNDLIKNIKNKLEELNEKYQNMVFHSVYYNNSIYPDYLYIFHDWDIYNDFPESPKLCSRFYDRKGNKPFANNKLNKKIMKQCEGELSEFQIDFYKKYRAEMT